jgi:thiol-disulfide isomerase/thioredoxin
MSTRIEGFIFDEPTCSSRDRRHFLQTTALGLFAGRLGLGRSLLRVERVESALADGPLTSLDHATGWVNSRPLTAASLRGKVVLVQFWTFTCVNWLRTLPYIRAWAEKYKDRGLVVIGAHAPEFSFEHDVANVQRAVEEMRIGYPVAIDNDFAIWRAFENNYWPALYLVDGQGRPQYHQFGEGQYDGAERRIQQLLGERGARAVDRQLVSVEPRGGEVAADWSNVGSSESYVGLDRGINFASKPRQVPNRAQRYEAPARMALNHWGITGTWTVGREAIALSAAGGRISYGFHARDVNLIMGPPAGVAPTRFRVFIDGQPPGEARGADVDEQGNGTAVAQRMYQLIRQREHIADRAFEIEFLDPGVEAYCFTFG